MRALRLSSGMESPSTQDLMYREAAAGFGASLARLAAGYERDPSLRQDLLQEMHVALWRSLATFKGQCSLRTWVYRVAHNTASTHVRQRMRWRQMTAVSLEELDAEVHQPDAEQAVDHDAVLAQVAMLIQRLKPIDQDVFLLYLEGVEAVAIAEIVGTSANNVAQKIHRAKAILQRHFQPGSAT